ncbi:MAG TPA: PLP-dependent aminotransferase family protein [Vicinamibacterales bacterium]|nr:PLP-dependent aminotransferase family protein [Vicinamibacterales bacterium]
MTQYETFFSTAGQSMRESMIRKMGAVVAQARDMISFAPGYPAEDAFPWEPFAEIARELLSGDDGSVLQYGPTRGYKPLRDVILGLMGERHVTASGAGVVVTTGSQQGLGLVARVLLDPGDVALLELPSYTGAITAFRSVGASLVGVRQDADGINLDELDRTVMTLRAEGRRVKFLYVVPNFQNPTGLLLALAKRPRLLEWAERRDVLIVEDDPYRDLWFPDIAHESDTRPIAADDSRGRVIYLSSFSKTLAPGLRVAWLHAPEPVAAKLELAKQADDLCTGGLDQRIVYEACKRGVLAANLPKLRSHYQHKRDAMVKALHHHLAGALTWPDPRGGFFLWGKLTGALQSDALLEHAQKRGVVFVTGSAFFVDGGGQQHLRLCFSAPAPDRIAEGVARLAAAVADASAISAATAR